MMYRGGAAWTGLAMAIVAATASCDAVLGIVQYGPGDAAALDGAPGSGMDGGTSSSNASGSHSESSSSRSASSEVSSSKSSGTSSHGSSSSHSVSASSTGSGSSSVGPVPDAGSGCVIGGNPQADGAIDPTNACQSCQPAASRFAWSDVADGTRCGTGGICHTGACVSGCEVGGVYYMTNAPDPTNPCQTCEPATSTSAWTAVADGMGCGNGQVCASGECGTMCDIGGKVYATAAPNPTNPCQTCEPGTSSTMWTSTAGANAACPAGDVCNGSPAMCTAGCFIDGAFVVAGVANPSDPCQSCDPTGAGGTTEWTGTDGVNGACAAGEVCTGSPAACADGCFIDGAFDLPATTASNGCEVCTPSSSVSSWTDVTGPANCGAGEVCQSGACVAGCYIDGFYGPGEAMPGNPCETCQPTMTVTAWSYADGASCGGGGGICSAGACNCTLVVTSSLDEMSSYGSALTVTYTMVGAGGGAGSGVTNGAGGGGGGSSAVLAGGILVDYAAGGAGGSQLTLGVAGLPATGTFVLAASEELTVYVGGGGGGGYGVRGADGHEGAGGSGYYGGGGAGDGVGGGGGTNVGGTPGGTAPDIGVAGTEGAGGESTPPNAPQGGDGPTGGAAGVTGGGGGGGGGYGGGGGGDGSAGGSSGAPTSPAADCGSGALSWSTATALPPAAGAGGATEETGGNGGLVILTYTAATCPL